MTERRRPREKWFRYGYYLINYIASFGYDAWHFLFGDIRSRIHGLEYYRQSKNYPGYLKRGDMGAGVRDLALQYCSGRGVDVGASHWPLPGARAIDNTAEEHAHCVREHDGSLDFVFSSHTLEHLVEWQEALRHWQAKLKPGGVLFLYLPHSACTMWRPGVNREHAWTPETFAITHFLQEEMGMTILESSSLPDGLLSFAIVARKY